MLNFMNLTTDIYVPIYYPCLCTNLLSMFMYQLTTHGYIPSYYPCLCTNLLPMFVYQLTTHVYVPNQINLIREILVKAATNYKIGFVDGMLTLHRNEVFC